MQRTSLISPAPLSVTLPIHATPPHYHPQFICLISTSDMKGSSTQKLSVHVCVRVCSVHPFATVDGSTVTRDLMLVVLQVKLVVIGQLGQRGTGEGSVCERRAERRGRSTYLLSSLDAPAGADDDLVLLLHRHHLRDAVGRTRVVDVPANHRHRSGRRPQLSSQQPPHPEMDQGGF